MQKNPKPIAAPSTVRMTSEEWHRTHSDFKGHFNGQRYVLQMTNRGTSMVPVEIIEDKKQ